MLPLLIPAALLEAMLEASVWLIPVAAALHAAAFRLLPWWADAMAWGCVPMLALLFAAAACAL